MNTKVTVLIADDSVVFSEGLEQLLSHNPMVKETILSHDYTTIMETLRTGMIDIIILDLNFDDAHYDGFKIAKEVKALFPEVKIIILTQHAKVDHYETLINDYEVDGYIDKKLSVQQLFTALEEVYAGMKYIDPNVADMVQAGRWLKLSAREKEVLSELSKGYTQKEVAARLFIGPKTVESHIRNLCERFFAKNSVELVSMYIQYKSAYREDYKATTPPFNKI
ncbi:response regulator transcription factor [Ascidiimonas aurantiaca]|uniref:response regulator transcription factor n=1 Tax=Ascidiimonas aurantiaca TaxID=1685432 RepID=UPI0030EB933F